MDSANAWTDMYYEFIRNVAKTTAYWLDLFSKLSSRLYYIRMRSSNYNLAEAALTLTFTFFYLRNFIVISLHYLLNLVISHLRKFLVKLTYRIKWFWSIQNYYIICYMI